jgi:hypothetical protein
LSANTSPGSHYTFTKYFGRRIFIVVSIIFIILLVDTSIIRVSDLILKSSASIWTLGLFTIIAAISLAGQNLILRFIRQKIDESIPVQRSLRLDSLYKVAATVHYVLASIIVFIILEMLITSRYNAVLLITAITISYVFAVAMIGILCHRFFSWFRLNKNYVMLLYGLSFVMLAANACITLWLVNSILFTKPGEIMPHVLLNAPVMSVNPINNMLNYAYIITTITSFIITWCATIGLLKNYTHKLGKFAYWIVFILPLAYFISQFLVLSLGLLGPLIISNPIFYGILFTIIFTLSKPIGGIIFGIGFWLIAKNIHKDNVVRSYLIISAYGFMLLFASNQSMVLAFTPYPPFGLATISFVGLSSYLVLVGVYSSALSISMDANLRREIRNLAIKESRLLDSIGLAQIEDELKKRVIDITKIDKKYMAEAAAVPSTLDDQDINQYLDDVLKEIKTAKNERPFTNENP